MSEENNVTTNIASASQRTYYPDDTLDLANLLRTYIKKWLILGSFSIVVAVIVLLGLKFFYNKNARVWNANFEFEFPGIEDELYPDGTTFKAQDFINQNIYEAAINANSNMFVGLSAETLYKKGAISISKNYEQNADKEKVFNGIYTFTIKQNCFNGSEQASEFVSALLCAMANKIATQADNAYFHTYIDSYDDADTFQAKLNFLVQQKKYVDQKYDEWIENYGEQYTIDGFAISKYKQNALLAMSEKEYDALNYELQKCQYVYNKSDDEEIVSKFQIEILNDEYEDNAKKIENLTAALIELRDGENGADLTGKPNETAYYEKIAELTERQVDIEREISNINVKLSNINATSAVEKYATKMNAVRDNLDKQATILEEKVVPTLYAEKTIYNVESFKSAGGFSAVVGAIIAFVLTYLVVGFFMFIMDEGDKKNNR